MSDGEGKGLPLMALPVSAATSKHEPRSADPTAHLTAAGQGPCLRRGYLQLSVAMLPASRVSPLPRLAPPRARHHAVAGLHRGSVVAASVAKGKHHEHQANPYRLRRHRPE